LRSGLNRPWWENALPEEVEAGAAEHLALKHLDAVDVPFYDSGAPGHGEAGDDGVTSRSMPAARV
jgi:hypothetical protein